MLGKKFTHIYLHVGHDKTGSSAIQDYFYLNRTRLEKEGVYFPSGESHQLIGSVFNHQPADYVYNQAHDRMDPELVTSIDQACLHDLQEQLSATAATSVLLSYEGLCTLDSATHSKIRSFFSEIADRVSVIYFCRSPLSYAISAASERIKGGGFAWSPLPFVPFSDQLQAMIAAYDRENVVVRQYAPSKGENVLSMMCSIVGISDPGESGIAHLGRNMALTHDAFNLGMRMIEILNGRLHWKIFNKRITPLLENIQGRPVKLAKAHAAKIASQCQVHIDYLEQEFGIQLQDGDSVIAKDEPEAADDVSLDVLADAILRTLVPVYDVQNRLTDSISLDVPLFPIRKKAVIAGELVKFSVPFVLAEEISRLEIGIHVLNERKEFVYGTNSLLLESNFLNISGRNVAGYYFIANLPAGTYWVGIAFAEALPESRRELAWLDCFFVLEVSMPIDKSGVGIVPLTARISLVAG